MGKANPIPGSINVTICNDCLPGSYADDEGTGLCSLCEAGKYQSANGRTACMACPRGFYCTKGSSTPVPCKGGTSSNATGAQSADACTPVVAGEWAPLGSALPEPCPASGFFCPGYAEDNVNQQPGSKPIIIPVGDSTTTTEVETVQKQMTLDVSCATFDYAKVKQSLATEYNVDVALISFPNPCSARRRMRALATLTFTISIATEGTAADGTPVSAPVANLLSAVQGVSDAELAGSLGTALGTAVTVTTTAPSQATVKKTVKFTCPKGKWCTAGLIVDCTEGTYNPVTGADLGTACLKCPEFSTSPKASTSLSDCVCEPGFIQTTLADGTARCKCDAGYEIMNGVRCDPCPV